jgi:two-component system, OmpR family, phosphate regulon sensor histidine kinase PhoR
MPRDGALRRANPAAIRIFALGPRAEGIPPEMVSRRADFLNLVQTALAGEAVAPRELAVDGRSLLGTAHPLPDGGAVLVSTSASVKQPIPELVLSNGARRGTTR